MGFRAAIVVCAASFLLGALSVNWIADSLTLWQSPVTDQHLRTAAVYYTLLAKAPPWIPQVLLAALAIGAAALAASARDGRAGNIMFDGASLFLYGTAAAVYLTSVVPLLQRFAPINFGADSAAAGVPPAFSRATMELATLHVVCSVALTGVLALQAGRQWAEGEQAAEDSARAAEPPAPGPVPAAEPHAPPEKPAPEPRQTRAQTRQASTRGRRRSDEEDEPEPEPPSLRRKETGPRRSRRKLGAGSGGER